MGELPMLRRVLALALMLAAVPAMAGEPYEPPTVTPGGRVEPPADLLADIEILRAAITARDLASVAPFIGPKVDILNGAIDLHVKRRVEPVGPWADAREALKDLGQNTGGDWDPSSGADLGDVLTAHALEFWGWMLEGDIAWGLDPLAPDAICTYEAQTFDADKVARVAAQLDVSSASFVMVDVTTPVLRLPGLRALVGWLEPGKLYALDYDTETPSDGIAVHLSDGGEGFLTFPDEGMLRPYNTGLCFEKGAGGRWQVTAQTNTTL